MKPPHLVALAGPTAVGKTALAIQLALRYRGEIIGADSRQIYRHMDIGTAKPTAAERARVPHHLIDLVAPDEGITLAQYQQMAYAAVEAINGRGNLPIIVGGTGLYLKTVVQGWTIPAVEPDSALRTQLEQEAVTRGPEALWQRLRAVDPLAASRVDARNVRRVIRYLEVHHLTGEPISAAQRKSPPPFAILQLGLTLPRETLYRRIDARVDEMFAAGFVDEVRALLARGYAPDLPALSGFGYHQIIQHLRGECTLAEAIAATKQATRRFVRRQYAWYHLDDPAVRWLRAEQDPLTEACDALERFLHD